MSEQRAAALNLRPRARIVATSATAQQTGAAIVDPATGMVQPVPSTQSAGTQLLGLVTA